MARLHVDWTRCDGHGLCAELLPELLVRDDWGYPLVRGRAAVPGGRGDAEVPRGLEDHADRAVVACPLMALRLTP